MIYRRALLWSCSTIPGQPLFPVSLGLQASTRRCLSESPAENDASASAKVLLIDQNGKSQGHQLMSDAKNAVLALGMHLVPVNVRADPPVYKISLKPSVAPTDSSEMAKNGAPSKPKLSKQKEVKMTSRTEPNDYKIKTGMIRRFLSDGHPVQVLILLRSGRRFQAKENRSVAPESLRALFDRICTDAADVGRLHGSIRDIGWRYTFKLHPLGHRKVYPVA